MKYKVCCGASTEHHEAAKFLTNEVQDLIEQGWMPMGAPFCVSQNIGGRANKLGIYQAMVLPDRVTHVVLDEDDEGAIRPPRSHKLN